VATIPDAWTIAISVATVALAAVAAVQAGLFVWQLRLLRQSTFAAADSAASALKQAEAIRLAERAYVKLSHRPFLFDFENRKFTLSIEVKNWGRTPASVLGVSLKCEDWLTENPLPGQPTYAPCEMWEAFLVAGEAFYFDYRDEWGPPEFDPDLRRLLLYGYVDYIDIFGRRHRAGYGRFYSPAISTDLVFIDQPGYNYDKEMPTS
jgi:hypothetical protein